MINRCCFLVIACIGTVPGPLAGQEATFEPVTYYATYLASANGLKASAVRSLTRLVDNDYELLNALEATVLGQEIARLTQRSQFHIDGDRIITDSYSYRLSGISSDQRSIEFNWQVGSAVSIEEDESWIIELQEQTFDPLSHQFALSRQLQEQPTGNFASTYEFNVIDGDEIEQHRYQLTGAEVLETPLGKLNSLKFERVRATSSSRSTTIWVAPDWGFLVARIEQVNGSGLNLKLELETAEVNGSMVTALSATN